MSGFLGRQIPLSPEQIEESDRLLGMSDEEAATPPPWILPVRTHGYEYKPLLLEVMERALRGPLPDCPDPGRFSEKPPWIVPAPKPLRPRRK